MLNVLLSAFACSNIDYISTVTVSSGFFHILQLSSYVHFIFTHKRETESSNWKVVLQTAVPYIYLPYLACTTLLSSLTEMFVIAHANRLAGSLYTYIYIYKFILNRKQTDRHNVVYAHG
jgi:hypothetical protein